MMTNFIKTNLLLILLFLITGLTITNRLQINANRNDIIESKNILLRNSSMLNALTKAGN